MPPAAPVITATFLASSCIVPPETSVDRAFPRIMTRYSEITGTKERNR